MKTLVTGSSGFIGRWVCSQLLARGHEVAGLDKAPAPDESISAVSYLCDILDGPRLGAIMREYQPDAVIHLAARTDLNEKNDIGGYAANIDGVRNVIDAVRHTPSIRRVVYTSSQLVCKVGHVPREMDEYCPNTLYGQSKVLTERIVKDGDGGGVEWCLVRPTTVWGPGMSPHYQQMLALIKQGRFFHCGHGKLRKSYSYAGNIAHQYLKLLAAPSEAVNRHTFYLADYEPLSLRDYANDLARELGAKPIPTVPVFVAKALGLVGDFLGVVRGRGFPFNSFRLNNILTEYVFDLTPTHCVCGPSPFTYQQGVHETAAWYLRTLALHRGSC
ncbi:MAG: NAD(P)-dependent oxidoreductase [Verrucomicrobia bacterium]|nr:NAD(P)-dependent oxidoreductase [Verrucomicrobiota bacterium]